MAVVKWDICILYPHSGLSKITWTSRNKQWFLRAALFNVAAASKCYLYHILVHVNWVLINTIFQHFVVSIFLPHKKYISI